MYYPVLILKSMATKMRRYPISMMMSVTTAHTLSSLNFEISDSSTLFDPVLTLRSMTKKVATSLRFETSTYAVQC